MSLLRIGEIKLKPTMLTNTGIPYYVFTGDTFDGGKGTVGDLYGEITSNENWMTLGRSQYDYLFCRNQVMMWTAVNGFSGLTTEEKKVAASHFSVGSTDRASVFTEDELVDHWGSFLNKSRTCRDERWKTAKSYISYLLPMVDSIDMGLKLTTISNNYIVYGVESLATDGTTGLYDWIENSGSYSGGTGFSGQTYWTQEYQDNLSSILRNGYK